MFAKNNSLKTKKNFYILDPHASSISKSLAGHIFNLPFDKLSYLKNLINNKEIKVCLHISNSLPIYKLKLPLIGYRIYTVMEYIIWLIINKYNWTSFCSIYNIPRGSIVYIDKFNKFSKINIKSYEILDRRDCRLIFYFSHFFFNISIKSQLLKRFKNSKFIAESILIQPNCSKIDESKFLFFPYSAEERFFNAGDNSNKRNPKILVVGSVVKKDAENKEELKKEYGDIYINPNRIEFYEKHIHYSKELEYIPSFYDPIKNIREGKKNRYLSLNTAEYFSSYEFFVCPEDITGMPSQNMIEGLAAGCIYFGNSKLKYFKDYQFLPFKHYIPYDGSIEHLINQWEKYKDDINLLSFIRESIKETIISYSIDNLSLRFSNLIKKLTSNS